MALPDLQARSFGLLSESSRRHGWGSDASHHQAAALRPEGDLTRRLQSVLQSFHASISPSGDLKETPLQQACAKPEVLTFVQQHAVGVAAWRAPTRQPVMQ